MPEKLTRILMHAADLGILPLVVLSGLLLKAVRRVGLQRMPLSRTALRRIGVLPVRDHYYEPLINPKYLRHPLDRVRLLSGIDLDEAGQSAFLAKLRFGDEWKDVQREPTGHAGEFFLDNSTFGPGDADIWYSIVRERKPRLIVEIGSGFSTLVARRAIQRNIADDSDYRCRHVCIEPYESPWLESVGVEAVRRRVEDTDRSIFGELRAGDIVFIDSSHVIRPQGDVLTEYLEILPALRPGVLVHVHDIFTPRDYPARWIDESALLWNEQYLVEAFLTCNPNWAIRLALNHLFRAHFDALQAACPCLSPSSPEPGSLYIERIA